MKNFLKISVALLLAMATSNTFANSNLILRSAVPDWINTDKCDCEEYQTENTTDDTIKEFFEISTTNPNAIHPIDGEFNMARANNSNMNIVNVDDVPGAIQENLPISQLLINSGKTLYFKPGSALTMGCGSSINVKGKLYLAGDIRSEKTSTIEIGDKNDKTGGYCIINANDPLYISGLTINLNDNKSHLEVHGTDISFTDCVINIHDPNATLHMQNELFKNAKFNPEVVELY